MSAITILSITSCPLNLGSNSVIGGGERRVVELLKRWHSYGVNIKALETEPSPSKLLNGNYDVRTISLPLKGSSTVAIFTNFFLVTLWTILFLFKLRNKVDAVVIFNGTFTNVAPAWFFSKLFRKPLIIGFQISSYDTSWKAAYRMKRDEGEKPSHALWLSFFTVAMLRLARSADAILCLSQPIADLLKELGFPSERLHVNGMGLNFDEIQAAPEQEKRYDAIFLGRVEEHKGIKEMITAWQTVTRRRRQARLVIIGGGDYLDRAKKAVAEARLGGNIEFIGFIAGGERFKYLKMSRVFLYPSKIREGWGLSIAEALACGLPALCSESPVFRSIFGDCLSTFFTPVGDAGSLAQAILDLLEDEEEQLQRYGDIARDYVRQYDWEAIARQELKIVGECVRRRVKSPTFL